MSCAVLEGMTPLAKASEAELDHQSRDFYCSAMQLLRDEGVPFMVGGAYALARYTGIERHTKDFDIFICRDDFSLAREAFQRAGYEVELTFPHWLGKAFRGEDFVDLIYGAGNGVARVDEVWFRYAVKGRVFGMDVDLIPVEEMIWSKGLIMERERFDGADVAHLILAMGEQMDWRRLINRYGEYWRVLFAHVIMFGFCYPSDRSKVPPWVIQELSTRLAIETAQPDAREKISYGTILSRQQYLADINDWGYTDARLRPLGKMTPREVAHWTAGIDVDGTK